MAHGMSAQPQTRSVEDLDGLLAYLNEIGDYVIGSGSGRSDDILAKINMLHWKVEGRISALK
jgi:hypothetical protein